MPLILKPEAYDEWLDPGIKEPARIEEILRKGLVKELRCYPVSKLVNQVGNNSKECMEPLWQSLRNRIAGALFALDGHPAIQGIARNVGKNCEEDA